MQPFNDFSLSLPWFPSSKNESVKLHLNALEEDEVVGEKVGFLQNPTDEIENGKWNNDLCGVVVRKV